MSQLWKQEPLWVRRNDQGVIVGIEERLPKGADFIPTVSSSEPVSDPDIDPDRADKLYTYFDHFDVEERYGINFKEFVRRVNNNSWNAYLS